MLHFGHMKYDFIGIGDVTTDCFIRLKDAHVTCKINNEDCEISMPFGSKLPYESATEVWATGNSSNAALCVANSQGRDRRGRGETNAY